MKAILFICLALLTGCAASPISLTKASSVDDYCSGVGDFAYALSEQVSDYNRNNSTPVDKNTVKTSLTGEIQRTVKDLPDREYKKMMDVVDIVFDNLSISPDQVARKVHATCVAQRNDNTWFNI